MRLYLKNLRLIDGTGAPARAGAALVIEGDTLVHVGPLATADEPNGPEVETIDLGGRTVIPGLVEAHIHLSYNNVKAIADLDLNCPPEYSTLKAARNAELALNCGYTAARSSTGSSAHRSCRSRACSERAAIRSAPRSSWTISTGPTASASRSTAGGSSSMTQPGSTSASST